MRQDRITWRETRRRLAEDRRRIRPVLASGAAKGPLFLILYPAYLCVLLHRISHYWWRRGMGKPGRLFYQLNLLITGADIDPHCDLGGGLLIRNPTGVVLSGKAGRNLTVASTGGFGYLAKEKDVGAGPGLPVLGDDVSVGPTAGVLGPVRIGDHVRIRTGCIVTRDVPAGAVVEQAAPPIPVTEPPRVKAFGSARRCDHQRPSCLMRDVRQDLERYQRERNRFDPGGGGLMQRISDLLSTEVMAVAIYRVSHLLHANGLRRVALVVCWMNVLLNKLTINPASCIGGGLFMPHPAGIVFNGRAGRGVTIYPAGLCTSADGALTTGVDEGPTLGDGVVLESLAGVIGPVEVGDKTRIRFRVQLCEHSPPDSVVTGAAGRVRIRPREGSGTAGPVGLRL